MSEGNRPKSTLSERLVEHTNRTSGSIYQQNSSSKNSSNKKQRPGSNFIQKSSNKN